MSETNNQKPTGRRKVMICLAGLLAELIVALLTKAVPASAHPVLSTIGMTIGGITIAAIGGNAAEHWSKAKALVGQAKPGG